MNGIQQIKGMMQMLRASKDPQQMLQSMASQNPQIKQIMDYIQQSGGDAKAAFYKLANEKGIDPNQILNMLKQ